MSREDNKILNTLYDKEIKIAQLGYDPIFIALKGSQNYDMDNEKSDVDAICFVAPSMKDLFFKREVSTTYGCENGELIDIKDIRLLVDLLKKANPSYLEILFTKYIVPYNAKAQDLVRFLQENREAFASANKSKLLRSCVGTINGKIKNMYHDSPARADDIKQYGYCLKEIHHAFRLTTLLEEYFDNGKTFEESLVPQEPYKTFLMTMKEVPQSLEKIKEMEREVQNRVDKVYKDYQSVEFRFNEELFNQLTEHIYNLVVR